MPTRKRKASTGAKARSNGGKAKGSASASSARVEAMASTAEAAYTRDIGDVPSTEYPTILKVLPFAAGVWAAAAVYWYMDWTLAPPVEQWAATKKYGDFESFYPFYLTEHSNAANRRMHFAGTTLSVLWALRENRLLLAASVAGCLGYIMTPLLLSLQTGLVEGVMMMLTFIALGKILTGRWGPALGIVFLGYTPAWLGHFFIEQNKPASWIYPVYSLFGDFRMWWQMLTGALPS